MHRKAQTATEYMIILAVVIIIALIVVGVMGGIPGIGTGARSGTSSAYWKTAKIAVSSYSATEADTVTLKIRNNMPNTIKINYFNMSSSGSSIATTALTQTDVTLGPGTEKTFTGTVTNICNAAGDAWTANVWVQYTDDETGAVYVFKGEGNKLEGVCAN